MLSASCGVSPPSFNEGSGGAVAVGGALATGGGALGSGGGGIIASGGAGTSGGGAATGGANAGGMSTAGGPASGGENSASGGGPAVECTDVQLPDHQGEPCSQWAEWGQCEEDYVLDYCDKSCGRCTDDGGGTGGNSNGNGGGSNGNDNPWGTVTNGQAGWTSRYWDCCKQSCGWSNNAGGNPVKSCDASGDNQVAADQQSACSGGSSTTCNSMVPKVYSDAVSFGFVATHAGSNVGCGKCYKLQFTGSGHNSGADPGSAALKDKIMIVMTANIGGDVSSDGQLDLLIPGGGTGALYGCGTAWGVQKGSSELGAEYGGLRTGCSGDLNSIKSCVKQKCDSLFGSRGLEEMYEGCMWYVDWFEAADNPNFTRQDVDCPSEIRSMAY